MKITAVADIMIQHVIVGYADDENLFAFGPFECFRAAAEYADEFGGAWVRWNIIPLQFPKY